MKEAIFYKKLKENKVQCTACNRYCVIEDGKIGNCGVRKNIGGKLQSLVYNRTLTLTVDPVEKKPLFHFRPGTHCLGISTFGCNFHCLHCQNSDISQEFSESKIGDIPQTTPKEIVERTLEAHAEGIAYTYTEPTVFAEYALDTMKLASKKGLYNVWVSNGYMTRSVIDAISPYLDAINIDLKGNARFYKEVCGNVSAEKVMENIRYLHEKKIHDEITYLIIPGYNDNDSDIQKAVDFVATVDKGMPLHFSRFFPQYKMNAVSPTPNAILQRAREIAKKAGLQHVYLGNVGEEENTFCQKCNALLVRRIGYSVSIEGLKANGACKNCGTKTGIVL